MASRAYFAWSPITIPDVVRGEGVVITIPVGDKVTRNQVGEDWANLVSTGSIRTEKYPQCRTDESPRTAKLRAVNEAMERAMAPFDEDNNPDLGEGLEVMDDDESEIVPNKE